MLRRPLVAAVIGALAVATVSAVATEQASARRAPSVVLATATPHIDVGTGPRFNYSTSSDTPASAVAQLQRQLTATTWKVVVSPALTNGATSSVTAPAVGTPNRYVYRMQVLNGGTVIATTAHDHPVLAYANIAIETLCPHTTGTRDCVHTKTVVNGVKVRTHMAIGAAVFPNYFAGAHYATTSCRSATLFFTNPKTLTSKTWLKIHQAGHADQLASASRNRLGHLTATLYGGSMYFDGSTEITNNPVYLDGTLSCWTTTGIPT